LINNFQVVQISQSVKRFKKNIILLLLCLFCISCQTKTTYKEDKFYTLEEIISTLKKENNTTNSSKIEKISNYSPLNCPIYLEETGYLNYTCVKEYKTQNKYKFYISTEVCQNSTQICFLDENIQAFTKKGISIFCYNTKIIPITKSYERQEIDTIRYTTYRSKKYFF